MMISLLFQTSSNNNKMKTDWSETMFRFDEEEAELLATSTIEVYEPVKSE